MNRQPLSIGIIGLGRWGRNYVSALQEAGSCRIVALADPALPPDLGPHTARRFRSADALLADPSVEAVVIATPDSTHYQIALSALQSGRHILVEKPLALNAADATRLVDISTGSGLVLAVGHTPLYHSSFRRLCLALSGAAADQPVQLRFERTSRGQPGTAESLLFDLGPHDIAQALHLFGNPLALRGRRADEPAARACFFWQAEFAFGKTASGRLAWIDAPPARSVELVTTGVSQRFTEYPPSPGSSERPLTSLCRDFIDSCLAGRPPRSDGKLGLEVTRALEALALSAARGGSWQRIESAAAGEAVLTMA